MDIPKYLPIYNTLDCQFAPISINSSLCLQSRFLPKEQCRPWTRPAFLVSSPKELPANKWRNLSGAVSRVICVQVPKILPRAQYPTSQILCIIDRRLRPTSLSRIAILSSACIMTLGSIPSFRDIKPALATLGILGLRTPLAIGIVTRFGQKSSEFALAHEISHGSSYHPETHRSIRWGSTRDTATWQRNAWQAQTSCSMIFWFPKIGGPNTFPGVIFFHLNNVRGPVVHSAPQLWTPHYPPEDDPQTTTHGSSLSSDVRSHQCCISVPSYMASSFCIPAWRVYAWVILLGINDSRRHRVPTIW